MIYKDKGDTIGHDDYNQIVDAVNKSASFSTGGSGFAGNLPGGATVMHQSVQARWIGKVVAGTQTDMTYTVQKCYITNDETDDDDAPITFDVFLSDDPNFLEATVTNLSEINGGTHRLTVGTFVEVVEEWDIGSPTSIRYWMEHAEQVGVGQYQYQDYTTVAQNTPGWDFNRSHSMLP